MCRMIAFNGKIDAAAALASFARLAECGCVPEGVPPGHRDGWGIAAWSGAGGTPSVYKNASPADAGSAYAEASAQVAGSCPALVMAHLRKASIGVPSLANTHPFIDGRFAFCHNGSIFGNEKIVLAPASEAKIMGSTDSERFFQSIMQDIGPASGSGDIEAAYRQSIGSVRIICSWYSLTSLLCDGKYVWAVREANGDNAVVREKGMIGYYALFAGAMDGEECVISSEKLDLPGVVWRDIENHAMCRISARSSVV